MCDFMLTCTLPDELEHTFEQVARSLYKYNSTQHALIDAVALWLEQHREQAVLAEEAVNNAAFENLRLELNKHYQGKWIMIAHGEFQGSADFPDQLNQLAPDALHRIVVQIGYERPQEVELGWQMTFA